MENFSNWFLRSQGTWRSYRRYLTLPAKKDDGYTTEFTIKTEDNKVNISWDGDASSGEMNLTLDGNVLHRDIGYFTDDPNDSMLERIDEDTIVLFSAYDGMEFREEIRLLCEDTARLRQTVGFRKGKPFLVGQYWEEKL